MFWIVLTALIGINFAPFVFVQLDIWHAQGFFFQVMVLGMFAFSLRKNLPLALFIGWCGLNTSVFCFMSQTKNQYNVNQFFPFFNLICMVIFYQSILASVKKVNIIKIIDALRMVCLIQMGFCVLQVLGFSQFFQLLYPGNRHFNNLVVGFIGQPTHLSGLLAMCAPLFFIRRNLTDILGLVLMFIILFFTGTTKGDPSISGFAILIVCSTYYLFNLDKKKGIILVSTLVGLCIAAFFLLPHGNFFHPHGRYEIWSYYIDLFRQMPVTGAGLGIVRQISPQTDFPRAHHLHLEGFQLAFELGVIGFILFMNLVFKFFKSNHTNEIELMLKTMFLGFLISSCFNYPAHLWLPSSLAVFAYAGFIALKAEDKIACLNETSNKKSSLSYH